jgi:hypothetical protein
VLARRLSQTCQLVIQFHLFTTARWEFEDKKNQAEVLRGAGGGAGVDAKQWSGIPVCILPKIVAELKIIPGGEGGKIPIIATK